MKIAEAMILLELAERGVTSYMQLKAMRDVNITDEMIEAYLAELIRVHHAHQALDLREPKAK